MIRLLVSVKFPVFFQSLSVSGGQRVRFYMPLDCLILDSGQLWHIFGLAFILQYMDLHVLTVY